MGIIVLLIPISIILIGIGAIMFVWAVNNDQFEQLDLHGFDIFDDQDTQEPGDDS